MPRHTDKLANMAASARKARARNIKLAKLFSLIIVVAAAFVGGFAVRGDVELLDALGLTQLTGTQDAKAKAAQTQQTYNSLSARVGEVETIVNKDSLDSYDLDTATTKMLDAFAVSTQDPYLRYYDPSRFAASSSTSDAADNGGGIGVLFNEYNGSAYAVDVFEGSPAQMADVQANDVVVSIDGDRSHAWSASEVTQAIKRDQGSQVVITWRRGSSLDDDQGHRVHHHAHRHRPNGEKRHHRAHEQRWLYPAQADHAELRPARCGRLSSIWMRRGAQSYRLGPARQPRRIPHAGRGHLQLLHQKRHHRAHHHEELGRDHEKRNGRRALPTSRWSCSSTATPRPRPRSSPLRSKDNERATLVGTTTLGKGSVQVTHELTFGGALRYTAAYYKSPLDHDIDGLGINPDISIGRSDDDDNQKSLAMETAQSMVRE